MGVFVPRLHVLLAREAPVGALIRRGPSRHVAVIGWDRRTDRFRVGQWLHGRIYERRSDLSPDGKHLLYFAMNGRWESKAKGAWTALSRAPYLKALTLLAKGDCWHGGGLFLSSGEYWLSDGSGHEVLHDESGLERSPKHPWRGAYGGEILFRARARRLGDGGGRARRPSRQGHALPKARERRLVAPEACPRHDGSSGGPRVLLR